MWMDLHTILINSCNDEYMSMVVAGADLRKVFTQYKELATVYHLTSTKVLANTLIPFSCN